MSNPQFSFKETIKRSLLNYPTLNTNPSHVVHHLFSVNGNGMEWYDGQLVSRFTDRADKQSGLSYLRECIREAKEKNMESLVLHYEWIMNQYLFTKKNIDRIVEHGEYRYKGKYYELCQYAKIMCVPKNEEGRFLVDDDWLKGLYQYASDAMTAFRMVGNENHPDFAHYKRLFTEFDNELIFRGIHSTHAERERMMKEILADLKKGN